MKRRRVKAKNEIKEEGKGEREGGRMGRRGEGLNEDYF